MMANGSVADAAAIFRDAAALNLTGNGYVWLVTEQLLQVANIPLGSVALRQRNVDNEADHISDSLFVNSLFH